MELLVSCCLSIYTAVLFPSFNFLLLFFFFFLFLFPFLFFLVLLSYHFFFLPLSLFLFLFLLLPFSFPFPFSMPPLLLPCPVPFYLMVFRFSVFFLTVRIFGCRALSTDGPTYRRTGRPTFTRLGGRLPGDYLSHIAGSGSAPRVNY